MALQLRAFELAGEQLGPVGVAVGLHGLGLGELGVLVLLDLRFKTVFNLRQLGVQLGGEALLVDALCPHRGEGGGDVV